MSAGSYTGGAQNQWGSDAATTANVSSSKTAGGMRGLGLIALVLGQLYIDNKVIDLAADYYNINKQDFDFFKSTHQAPLAATAAEAFDTNLNPSYVQDKYVAIPASAARVAELDRQWLANRKSLSRYATGAAQRLDYEYAKVRATQMAASWFLGWRSELSYAQEHNERQFNRKVTVVNIGIGVGNEVARGLASAAGSMNNALTGASNQLGSVASGLSGEIGRRQGAKDTQQLYRQIGGK
jgi:hypothetical protein